MRASFHSRLLIVFPLCSRSATPFQRRLQAPADASYPSFRSQELAGGDQVVGMKLPHEMRPGNRYALDAGLRRTLGELAARKIELVAVCRRCKHRRVLFTANLIARCGEGFPAIKLRDRLRCSNCRGRSANLHESSR